MSYRYILANIKTYEPVMQSDDINGVICKLNYLCNLKNLNETIKYYINVNGFYIRDKYTIIDIKVSKYNSRLLLSSSITHTQLLKIIQQAIRNINLSKLLD